MKQPEQELDGAEGQDRSSPLHVSGVQEPGEWDPSSPIRFGQVEHVERDGSADAEAEPALAFEEQQTSVVQVVIEVDTDGEGVQPTNVGLRLSRASAPALIDALHPAGRVCARKQRGDGGLGESAAK